MSRKMKVCQVKVQMPNEWKSRWNQNPQSVLNKKRLTL